MKGNLSARLNRFFIPSSCFRIVSDDFSITYNALNSKYIVMQVNIICLWQGYQAQGAFLKRLKCPFLQCTLHVAAILILRHILYHVDRYINLLCIRFSYPAHSRILKSSNGEKYKF